MSRRPKAAHKERSKSRHKSKAQPPSPKMRNNVRTPSPSLSPSPSPPPKPKAAQSKKLGAKKEAIRSDGSSATDLSDSSSSEPKPPPQKSAVSKKSQIAQKRQPSSSSDETSVSPKKKAKPPQKPSSQAVEKASKPAKQTTKQKEKAQKKPVEKKSGHKKADAKATVDTKRGKSNGNLDDIDANFGRGVVAAVCEKPSATGTSQQASALNGKQRINKADDKDSDATDIDGVMSDAESLRKTALAPPPPLPAPAPLPATLPLQPPTLLDLAQKKKKKKKKKDAKPDVARAKAGALLAPTPAALPSPATPGSAERSAVPTDPYMETEVPVHVVGDNNGNQDATAESREALAQRFVATQKELLRLQLEAKARQLARLKKNLQSKQQARTAQVQKAASAPILLPPHLAASILSGSKGGTQRPVAGVQRPVARPPGKNRFASRQWISTSKALEGSKRALRGVVEKHQEKVRAQREKLEDAQRRRRMLTASVSPQKADESVALAPRSQSGTLNTSGTTATRIVATPRNLAEAVALCKAAYDSSMPNNAVFAEPVLPAGKYVETSKPSSQAVSTIIDLDDDDTVSTAASSSQLPLSTQ